ncbi:MAG TPA: hypothetical protein VFH72_00680 [Candidatus Baltobacteraceae bacterium]|nr:hypothetical protein [Candidatus Baltobacteraceae bacterium]
MKRLLAMLMAFGAVALPALASTDSINYASPAGIVHSFYRDLLAAHGHGLAQSRYFTPRLANDLAWVEAAERCTHSAIMDWDPFSGAQVPLKAFTLGASRKAPDSTVRVTVELRLWKAGKSSVDVDTVKSGTAWRISDFIDNSPEGPYSVDETLTRQRHAVAAYTKLDHAERACLAHIPY